MHIAIKKRGISEQISEGADGWKRIFGKIEMFL